MAVVHNRLLVVFSLLVGAIVLVFAAHSLVGGAHNAERAAGATRTRVVRTNLEHEYQIVQEIYSRGFKNDWQERGVTRLSGTEPAILDLSDYAAWSLRHPRQAGGYDALVLRLKARRAILEALEVKLTSDMVALQPVQLTPERTASDDKGGWTEISIPWAKLNPERQQFDGVRIRALSPVEPHDVALDLIALARLRPGLSSVSARPSQAQDETVEIDCLSPSTAISPLIYGVANAGDEPSELRASAYRFGGNPASRFNWSLGNAWNTGNDWYFQNVNVGSVWEKLIQASVEREAPLTITLPMLGWVARDDDSYSFPVSVFGPQASVDPEHRDIGNGVSRNGSPIKPGDPLRTSIPAPPELIGQWVRRILKESQLHGRPAHSYILDNEPCLWNSTHRDVHPEPLDYDELLERTIRYGSAIRAADPEAIIAGPAEWGWSNYFWSAKDAASGFTLRPDRRAHGDVPLLDWYLSKLREHEAKTGVRVLDVVDLHFYPQGKNIYAAGGGGETEPETSQRRLRSTRALWDTTYVDESWINERIYLLPRIRDIIARNYPGRLISIGEWNFGAENHISGGLATAEALGRFAQAGIYSAYFWLAPKAGTPAYWAFRAFRNYDGRGNAFLEQYVQASSPKGVSVFTSRDTGQNRYVSVILVHTSQRGYRLSFRAKGCKSITAWRTFTYTTASAALVPSRHGSDEKIVEEFPPESMTVVEFDTNSDVPRGEERRSL